ncbi:hypothetical protein ACNHKD_08865 [Methylocystis sp. JAN1]|uniref:hypothetical protein n=1 Tax=Methylocystis sp. JAN1 TaxID=3397211 RepID=UPI003FA2E435
MPDRIQIELLLGFPMVGNLINIAGLLGISEKSVTGREQRGALMQFEINAEITAELRRFRRFAEKFRSSTRETISASRERIDISRALMEQVDRDIPAVGGRGEAGDVGDRVQGGGAISRDSDRDQTLVFLRSARASRWRRR